MRDRFLTSTAMIAAMGNGVDFKHGRQLAVWLGLVPRQPSSGERQAMMGISKRGNQPLRTPLAPWRAGCCPDRREQN